jgi:hypothetical protein
VIFSDDAVEPLPSLQLEFGDVVPILPAKLGLSILVQLSF